MIEYQGYDTPEDEEFYLGSWRKKLEKEKQQREERAIEEHQGYYDE